jgi:hypothetical protein
MVSCALLSYRHSAMHPLGKIEGTTQEALRTTPTSITRSNGCQMLQLVNNKELGANSGR